MLLPLQGVNAMIIRVTQGVASLALGYALLGFQPVHYWMQNHVENIMNFEHPTHSGWGWRMKHWWFYHKSCEKKEVDFEHPTERGEAGAWSFDILIHKQKK